MYGLFYNKTNIYYNMSKIIKLTESDVINLIKKVIKEQNKDPFVYDKRQLTADADSTKVNIQAYNPKSGKVQTIPSSSQREQRGLFIGNLPKISGIIWNARNASWGSSVAKTIFNTKGSTDVLAYTLMSWVSKNKNFDHNILKASISTILRESKGSAGTFIHYKEVLGFLDNLINNANHSQGYAQIQPATAKQYNIEMSSLYTMEGSFEAVYRMLSTNYNAAKKYYSGDFVTKFNNGKLIKEKALGDDAALHLAVSAHNAGTGILGKWCQTNMENIANKCNIKERDPYDNGKIAITDTSKPIDNYFPNKGGLHNYIPQFKKSFDLLSEIPKYL
jgi:hypothetical protein